MFRVKRILSGFAHSVWILLLMVVCLLVSLILFLTTLSGHSNDDRDYAPHMTKYDPAAPVITLFPSAVSFPENYYVIDFISSTDVICSTVELHEGPIALSDVIQAFELQYKAFFRPTALASANEPNEESYDWDFGDPVRFSYRNTDYLRTEGHPIYHITCGIHYAGGLYDYSATTQTGTNGYLRWHVLEQRDCIYPNGTDDSHHYIRYDLVLDETGKVVQIIHDGVTYEGEDGFAEFYALIDQIHADNPVRSQYERK